MFGAGYTDVYVRLLALRVSMIVAVLLALALIIRWRYQRKLIVGLLGAWIISGLLLGGIVPTLVQNWIVEPNEFEREREFLQYHIEMTRTAYGLDKFVVKEYPATPDLTYEDIDRHRSTVDNVRLWDPRVLLQTYGQLQEMRPYYRFSDVDVARYWIDGEYRQVMISARELVPEGLQTQSWINRHLQYTHGIGVVMNPSNEISRQRLPEFWISDIPPKSSIDIEITQPRIYFGERTNDYVIVNTLTDEFDYPMENRSATYRYSGADGVKISSFIDRLAFAFRFGNSRILLSTDITNESRILFDRNIFDRVKKIAPFLRYDQDPFVVVVDGRLKWIMDAYTVSTRFPYSEPTKGWGNYIRNSVKVVIDAYDGTVDFYQVEPDPIIEAYEKVFPGLVKPFEEMPENVRAHIRYPEDLLTIQALLYGTYHMNDRSFYNREDVWQLSRETYRGKDQEILPYYVIMDLPDEEPEPELVLMVPYTPARRPNMSAWLAARNDGKHYGEVIVYRFPIETSIWGPAQIEARIDQDPEISQLITLWSQSGSQVIRGNLLVLPIGEGILYVEPLYIQADQTSMPQLRRVIVAYGDDLVMADSLENAFVSLFGQVITSKELDEESISDDFDFNDENIATLSNRAHSLFIQAEEALTKGNFHLFGDLWNELREVLKG